MKNKQLRGVFLLLLLATMAIASTPQEGSQTVPSLLADLKSNDATIRDRAKTELTKMGKPAVEPILAFIIAESQAAARNLLEAATHVNDPSYFQLRGAAEQHDALLRRAFPILEDIGSPAVEPLIRSLNEPTFFRLKALAIQSLAKIGDKRAVGSIIPFLNDPLGVNRKVASEALEKLTGERFGQDEAKWQEWWAKNKPKE